MHSATDTVAQERDLNSLSLITVIVVLATVTMTFGAMIAVFVVRSEYNRFWGHIHVPAVLWGTTTLLFASSVTFETARRRLARNDQAGFFRLATWTTGLGVLFLLGQIAAWIQILRSGVVLAYNPHSWFIFLFTGLHGLHILLGLAGLAYLLIRTREPAGGPKYQMKTKAVAKGVGAFWHYLDFLWLLLFGLLLFWRP
ncbi:MAG: cytochrome c oxidase subunit 3 [Acidobacteriaceae bacterium]|nr:cytochrome c oxidase subunit 3 [Acidobacteriaceae bacterium]